MDTIICKPHFACFSRLMHTCQGLGNLSLCSVLSMPDVHALKDASCVMQNGVETLVPTGPYNIAFSRTPAEVLAIVYLGSASTPGGFFPAGVNGAIQG